MCLLYGTPKPSAKMWSVQLVSESCVISAPNVAALSRDVEPASLDESAIDE